MKSLWRSALVCGVAIVAVGSMAIGLSSPDGSVDGAVEPVNQGPRTATQPSATAASPAPSSTSPSAADPPAAGPDRAPATLSATWPGRPTGTRAAGGRVDWCGAVTTTGAAEAERVFGRRAVDAAACAAVSFVFDHRYSRLSLPRRDYAAADFDDVIAALDPQTVRTVYRPRLSLFIAAPTSNTAGEQLGLVLFTARDTADGAAHASAGAGHVFYGRAFTDRGYRSRAVWINPTWSSVAVDVDRSTSTPRLQARFTASAALPVWATASRADAMLTVPTSATFTMRHEAGASWAINGWTITRGDVSYGPLTVR